MTLPAELAQWRKSERASLIARRVSASAEDRREWSEAIGRHLSTEFPQLSHLTVAFCWPYQSECDLRDWAAALHVRGGHLALPVVAGKGRPLRFHRWWPGVDMAEDAYQVPIPVGTEELSPDVLLVPPVGIGPAGDRLGYGGGFFDRTLEARVPRPVAIAVAFELSRMPTTRPQAHDIPMDFLVTESGVEALRGGRLEPVAPTEAARHLEVLLEQRGLRRQGA